MCICMHVCNVFSSSCSLGVLKWVGAVSIPLESAPTLDALIESLLMKKHISFVTIPILLDDKDKCLSF